MPTAVDINLAQPLATTADLTDRNITVPDAVNPDAILAAASAAVRDAAGCPISQATSTVQIVSSDRDGFDLPGGPVASVDSVSVEGNDITASTLASRCYSQGWRQVGSQLLLTDVRFTAPAVFTVTYTHGYPVVPDDIVDLVCGICAVAFAQDGDYGTAGRLASYRLGESAETYTHPAGTDSPSPVTVPDSVRQRLRGRFGTSIAVIGISR